MKLSAKRKGAIYSAIHGPIMDLRLKWQRETSSNPALSKLDYEIAQLANPIYYAIIEIFEAKP